VGRRYLLFIDLILVWISAGTANLLTFHWMKAVRPSFIIPSPSGIVGFLFLFSILVVLFANLHGLYACIWQKSFGEEVKHLGESIGSAALMLIASLLLVGTKMSAILVVGPTIILSWLVLAAWRRFLHSQSIPGLSEKRNVLIIGGGSTATQLKEHLDSHPQLGYVVKGFVDRRKQPREENPAKNCLPQGFVGNVKELAPIVRAHFIDEIFVCVPNDRRMVMEIAEYARGTGVCLRVIPDLYDTATASAPVEYVGQFPTMTMQNNSIPSLQLMLKRAVDMTASASLSILLSPLLLLIALTVLLTSKGQLFYRSIRVGKKGKTFVCYKFRTMVAHAEAMKASLAHLNERDGVLFKIAKDPRITVVGKFLRRYSLDELPQLFNVLNGDMSLVGPRPPVPGEYKQYALDHLRRLDVKPGITGLWQVIARQSPSFENYIELDRQYVDTWSLWLDCRILWKTFGVVVAGTGQ